MKGLTLILLCTLAHGFRTKQYQKAKLSDFVFFTTLTTYSELQCSVACLTVAPCEGYRFTQIHNSCSLLKDIVIDTQGVFTEWINSILSSKSYLSKKISFRTLTFSINLR